MLKEGVSKEESERYLDEEKLIYKKKVDTHLILTSKYE